MLQSMSESLVEDFCAKVRKALGNRSMTGVAQASGLPRSAIRTILVGHDPHLSRVGEVAEALGLEITISKKVKSWEAQSQTAIREGNIGADFAPKWVNELHNSIQATQNAILSRLPEPVLQVAEDPAPYDSAGPISLSDDSEVSDTGTDDFLPAPYARDVRAAAGQGEVVFEEAAEFRFAFPQSILPQWVQPDSLLCIRTKGDSMEPTLHDGDLILLDYSRNNPLDGRIFVLRGDEGLVVKRLRGSGFDWELISDNPAYPPRRVDQHDRVIGRLAWSGPISARTSV